MTEQTLSDKIELKTLKDLIRPNAMANGEFQEKVLL